MGREAFNDAKKKIISSGFDIAESEYEEVLGDWYITLDTVLKIRLAWNNSKKFFSVEEETEDEGGELTAWKYIFASRLSGQNEIPATLENFLNLK